MFSSSILRIYELSISFMPWHIHSNILLNFKSTMIQKHDPSSQTMKHSITVNFSVSYHKLNDGLEVPFLNFTKLKF